MVMKSLSVALGVITLVDVVRLRSPRFASIYEKLLGFLMRDSEKVRDATRVMTVSVSLTKVAREI